MFWRLSLAHIHLMVPKTDSPNDLVSEEGHADCKVANDTKTDEEAVECN